MEENKGVTGASETPVETTPEQINATPVAPAAAELPKPAEASQAVIAAASETPAVPEPQAEAPKEQVEAPKEAAAAEQPPAKPEVAVNEELIEKAIALIKKTSHSSIMTMQHRLGLDLETAEALLDALTDKAVLGPKNGMTPRKILIACDPKPQKKPQPKPTPKKPQVPQRRSPADRHQVRDYDRMMSWRKHLAEIGHYTDEKFIEAMSQYALANPGYNPTSKWGSCLIVMVNRLANQLTDGLKTFTQRDADYLQRELIRFFSEKPLGDGPEEWNEKYTTNGEQKKVINRFFKIDAPYRELRNKPEMVMTAVRNAAWPNQMEERNGTGGTYAERFHYLAMCVVRFATSEFEKALFENSMHLQPTENFMIKVNGSASTAPAWIKDGKCECGAELTKDSRGHTICSNPICPHSIAMAATDVPDSFRNPQRRDSPRPTFNPDTAPVPVKQDNRKSSWKDKKRFDRHDGDEERAFRNPKKPHGKRFRVNEDDGYEDPSGGGNDTGATVVSSTPGGDNLGSLGNAFAGLNIPVVEKKEESNEQLPPPPAEVPVPEAAPADAPEAVENQNT